MKFNITYWVNLDALHPKTELDTIAAPDDPTDDTFIRDAFLEKNKSLKPYKKYFGVYRNIDGSATVYTQADENGHSLFAPDNIVVHYRLAINSVLLKKELGIINETNVPNKDDILQAIYDNNHNLQRNGGLGIEFTKDPGIVKVVVSDDSKIYGGGPVTVNYKITLSSMIKKSELGLVVNNDDEAVKPTETVIKEMLEGKYKDDLDTSLIKITIRELEGVATISPKNGNYVNPIDLTFKVSIKLYLSTNQIKEPINGFQETPKLKDIYQNQSGIKGIVDLNQTKVVANTYGVLTFKVNSDSNLYDSTEKYGKFTVSYKYQLSTLITLKDLGKFGRFPDDNDVKSRIKDNSGIVNFNEITMKITDDGVINIKIKEDSTLYAMESFDLTFKVLLDKNTKHLGTISPFPITDKEIFERITEANSN
jgi:hypothetical protein